MFEAEPAPLVVSDWMMPGLNGTQLCARIRASDALDYVYFILMTSKAEKADIATGLNAGADDYLSKPVDAEELLARVSAGERILSLQRSLSQRHSQVVAAHEKLQRIHAELEDDLRLAARVQSTCIPQPVGTCKDIPIATVFEPCAHVSGDLLGYFELNADEIAMYSIDVSGHGVAAALMSVSLSQAFNPHDRQNNVAFESGPDGYTTILEPHEIAERLNRRHQGDIETNQYFTMAFATINIFNGVVKLCQAGHPNPAIVRNSGQVEFAGEGGPPIGLVPDAQFETTRFQLARGDGLLLYSDGIADCLAPEASGEQAALAELIQTCAQSPLQEFSQAMKQRLALRRKTAFVADDISALYLEFRKQGCAIPRETPGRCGR